MKANGSDSYRNEALLNKPHKYKSTVINVILGQHRDAHSCHRLRDKGGSIRGRERIRMG